MPESHEYRILVPSNVFDAMVWNEGEKAPEMSFRLVGIVSLLSISMLGCIWT